MDLFFFEFGTVHYHSKGIGGANSIESAWMYRQVWLLTNGHSPVFTPLVLIVNMMAK